MKSFALCALLLAIVRSETIMVEVVNYDAMYNNECPTTTTAPAADDAVLALDTSTHDENGDNNGYENGYNLPGANILMSDNDNDGGYESKYDKYYKKYENKYTKKYEGDVDGDDNQKEGEVAGNENGGDDTTKNPEEQQESTFCKCLAEVKASGKTYAASQDEFSKCMDKANGNNAKHWEKVAQKYAHKYGIKTDSWELPEITTTILPLSSIDQDIGAVADVGDDVDDKSDDIADDVEYDDNDIPEGVQDADILDAADVVGGDGDDGNDGGDGGGFGNAAIYITFIGSSILLFICAWFVKDGFKRWKMREYENVKQMSSYESEADADDGGIYDANMDESDWDDNYNMNYKKNQEQKKGKKGKFSGWNQYSSV